MHAEVRQVAMSAAKLLQMWYNKLPWWAAKLLTVSEIVEGIRCNPDEREVELIHCNSDEREEPEIGEIQVAPALQTIIQSQWIHLLKETTDGLNDSIKQSKRL